MFVGIDFNHEYCVIRREGASVATQQAPLLSLSLITHTHTHSVLPPFSFLFILLVCSMVRTHPFTNLYMTRLMPGDYLEQQQQPPSLDDGVHPQQQQQGQQHHYEMEDDDDHEDHRYTTRTQQQQQDGDQTNRITHVNGVRKRGSSSSNSLDSPARLAARHAQFLAALDALDVTVSPNHRTTDPNNPNHNHHSRQYSDWIVQLTQHLEGWSVEETATYAYTYFVTLQQIEEEMYQQQQTLQQQQTTIQQRRLLQEGLSPGFHWTSDEIRLLHALLATFHPGTSSTSSSTTNTTPNTMARIATFFPTHSKEQVERQVYALQRQNQAGSRQQQQQSAQRAQRRMEEDVYEDVYEDP
jgi:hypothetical protein